MATKEKEEKGARAIQPGVQGSPTRPSDHRLPPAFPSTHPLRWLQGEMDALFDHVFGHWPVWEPPEFPERFWDIDVEESDNEIVVRAEAPGFEAKEFEVNVSGDTLTIQAEHKEKAEDKAKGSRRWEHRYARFLRSVPLSTSVNGDKVEAQYRNGILEVHLPRTEPSPRRRIEVKA